MENSSRFFSDLYDKDASQRVVQNITTIMEKLGKDKLKVMHVCGTHEHTVTYYGLRTLLPDHIKLIAGPGCPVCVTPAKEVDEAIYLAKSKATLLTYGDMYQTPGSRTSLAKARSEGAQVKIVYGFKDALELALENKAKEFVFFAVGFETTAPTVAAHVSNNNIPNNLSLLLSYRITIPIVRYILENMEYDLDGILAPGHVATITGSNAWKFISKKHDLPAAVAGFEPLDVLLAIYKIVQTYEAQEPQTFNEYDRVVTPQGNVTAKKFISKAFARKDGYWRGIGRIPKSIWRLRKKFAELDARKRYQINIEEPIEVRPGCKCAEVTMGQAKPTDCSLFKEKCTPQHPYGPCMVSNEGTCRIWAKYGGREVKEILST